MIKTDPPSRHSSILVHPSAFGKLISSPFFILVAFCAFALAPLTAPGYFSAAHDARHSVYFLKMFDLSIQDGAWYPRWAMDMVFGYGYPLWLILAPIPFFIGEAFHLVGFDFVTAVKIVDGLAILFSAITMYLFASRVLGKNAGLVAAIAYVYIPYHLVDLYVRAAQAELVAFVFPPLVCWAFYELATTQHTRFIGVAALAYAGLVFSHIQTAVLFTPIIGLYMIFLLFTTQRVTDEGQPTHSIFRPRSAVRFIIYSALAVLLALGLAAIFIVPVIFEQKLLTAEPLIGGFFSYRTHFVNANQLLSSFWGYGYAGENGTDQFSLQLGLLPILLALVAGFNPRNEIRGHVWLATAITVGIVLLMLPMARPLWDLAAPIVAYIQFPWRLLITTAFTLAFLSGAAIRALPDQSLAPILALVLLFVTANYSYTLPQPTEAIFNYPAQMEFEVKDRELLGDTIWMTGERPQDSPLVDQYVNGQPLEKAAALDNNAIVRTLRNGGQSTDVRVEAFLPSRVMVYTRYFPGWTATVDNQTTPIEPYGEQGLILINVPSGSHTIHLEFKDTPPRQIGAVISGLSLLVALGIMGWARLQNRKGLL